MSSLDAVWLSLLKDAAQLAQRSIGLFLGLIYLKPSKHLIKVVVRMNLIND